MTRNPPRTAADRAKDDLAAAERRHARAKDRAEKYERLGDAAEADLKEAADLVAYYRGAVEKLSGGAAVAGESA